MGTVLNPTAGIADGNGNTLILPMLGVVPLTPGGGPAAAMTITQTAVPVNTSSGVLIAANPARRYLAWMVVGTADVTITPGASAAVGVGMIYKALGANQQGASQEFQGSAVPTNAFAVIAAATGSTVIVWEGI